MRPEEVIRFVSSFLVVVLVVAVGPAAWTFFRSLGSAGTALFGNGGGSFMETNGDFVWGAVVVGVPVFVTILGLWMLRKWGLWVGFLAVGIIAYNSVFSVVGQFAEVPPIFLNLSLFAIIINLAISVMTLVFVYRYREFLE